METPEVLLGQLARELSLLVRSDLELAASERLPHIRRVVEEIAALIGVGIAALFALAALTWAGVRGLSLLVPGWASPLVLAAAWTLAGLALLRLDHPRRLAQRLHADRHRDIRAQTLRTRTEAEDAVRATAERLTKTTLQRAAQREVKALESLAEREMKAGETEVADLLRELITALTAPGRTSLTLLERLVTGRTSPSTRRH